MIRIFVGCASGDDLESQAVLEYSLRKHCSEPVDITWMALSGDPSSPFYSNGGAGWQTQRWSTPFSGLRWAIPALCGGEGRAIYLDSDVIVLGDIAELWGQEFRPGKFVMAKGGAEAWRFCVSVWDCAAAISHMHNSRDLRARPDAHQAMIAKMRQSSGVQAFDGAWNVIDGEDYPSADDPRIKLLHYSAENTQPHLKYALPRLAAEGRKHWFDGTVRPHWRADVVSLFDKMLAEAVANGYAPENYAPARPFGPYKIQSHSGYVAHKWAR